MSPPSEEIKDCELCQSRADKNFIMWNIEQGCSQSLGDLEHEAVAVSKRKVRSPSHTSQTPTYTIEKSIIRFNAVHEDSVYTDHGKTAKEVIGPKDFIPGHPLLVINSGGPKMLLSGQQLPSNDISHVTMLYRRFPSSHFDSSHDAPCIHSLQWMPIFMQSK